jgi:hypothetical protein
MKRLSIVTFLILLIGCSTGNDPLMSRSDAQNYCGKLSSRTSDYSMCVRHLMISEKFVKPCLEKGITPGTIEFNDCGKSTLMSYPDPDTNSIQQKKLQDEVNSLKQKQRLKEIQDMNKVIVK